MIDDRCFRKSCLPMELKFLATLLLVHGVSAKLDSAPNRNNEKPNCKSGNPQELVKQLDGFNNMLVAYANLGGSAKALSGPAPTQEPHARTQKNAHGNTLKADMNNKDISKTDTKSPESSHVVGNKHLIARAETHDDLQAHHSHRDEYKKSVTSIQLYAVRRSGDVQTSKSERNKNPYHAQIQKSFLQLRKQQQMLVSMQDTCIPDSHQVQVAGSIKNVYETFLKHQNNLIAAGSLVEEPTRKSKTKAKKISRSEKARRAAAGLPENSKNSFMKHQNAGWITMGADVNNGYNGNVGALTSTFDSTSTSTDLLPNHYAPQYNQEANSAPQYSQVYFTLTSTATKASSSLAENFDGKKHKVSSKPSNTVSDNESENSSDSSSNSDTESDSESESESQNSADSAPMVSTTSAHHNIIVRTYDGTKHLISGTIHLTGHILGAIFIPESKEVSRMVSEVSNRFDI